MFDEAGTGWAAKNAELIATHKVEGRQRVIPPLDVGSNLEAGPATPADRLPTITIAPGVSAKLAWADGVLLEQLKMDPGASYPEEILPGESLIVVEAGTSDGRVNGSPVTLTKESVIYLPRGTRWSLKAGTEGLKALGVHSPIREDHLKLAGKSVSRGERISATEQNATPSLEPGVVYNLNDIQLIPLTPPAPSLPSRSQAQSRLIWGEYAQLSFIRMDPNSEFPLHMHPEVQLMMALRGRLEHTNVDTPYSADGASRTTFYIPGGMVHSAKMSDVGADVLDVFWPVRPDYVARALKQQALYDEVIPRGVKPVRKGTGLTFAEGPTWLNGVLFFSDMFFRDPNKGDWTGDPTKSRLIQMDQTGKMKVLSHGMQTNGTIASSTGRLLVCDMFGHRVIEVDPRSGRTLRTVLDRVNDVPVDGPNDLVMDANGGVYITDPQFTQESRKSQPGPQVYYVRPDGTARVVIPSGEYAMPNGVEISPDGKTLYVNNTWSQPGGNFVWAYDIQADGSLSRKRKFATLNVAGEVLSASDPAKRSDSMADGMAVDVNGRLYVATQTGVQIFDSSGQYVGTLWVPEPPISLTFGGDQYNKLYIVSASSVWEVQTKVTGFRHPSRLH